MVKVSIEVRSGAASFRVGVRAESIERAVSLMERRFPARNVKVTFPIDPEETGLQRKNEPGSVCDPGAVVTIFPRRRLSGLQ